MKFTAVTPRLVDPGQGKPSLFVKVETSDGLWGWTEYSTQHPPRPRPTPGEEGP